MRVEVGAYDKREFERQAAEIEAQHRPVWLCFREGRMTWTPDKNDKAMINAACAQLCDAERENFAAKVAEHLQSIKNPSRNHVRAAITAAQNQGK